MRTLPLVGILLGSLLIGGVARADSWEKLGERRVNGRLDQDVIRVGAREGRFRRIMVKVDRSALEMFDVKVTFGDGETFSPNTRLVFGRDTTSRVIDLPGDARIIRQVEFRYANLPRGGRAQVELWADAAGGGAGPGERARERVDDRRDERIEAATGWEKLGERWVEGRIDRDAIDVGAREGRFRRVAFHVEHSAVEIFDIKIVFADGSDFSPSTRLVFGKGGSTRVIDLPGNARIIRRVELRYGNLPGGGRAQVEVWAK